MNTYIIPIIHSRAIRIHYTVTQVKDPHLRLHNPPSCFRKSAVRRMAKPKSTGAQGLGETKREIR
jgi:hypothetical protein